MRVDARMPSFGVPHTVTTKTRHRGENRLTLSALNTADVQYNKLMGYTWYFSRSAFSMYTTGAPQLSSPCSDFSCCVFASNPCMHVSPLNLYFHRIQPLVIFGLFGLPSSWLDVLSMDLDIGGLISQRTIKSYVSIFGTFLAFVRPTLPVRCPSWLHTLFPLVAWFLYSDNATVSPEPLLKNNCHICILNANAFLFSLLYWCARVSRLKNAHNTLYRSSFREFVP